MNPRIRDFLALAESDRIAAFQAAAADGSLSTLPFFVEKDFWVCTVLDALFNPGDGPSSGFIFKGGTSLSKCSGLIKRFSEDIDLILPPRQLGFEGANDPTSAEFQGSESQRRDRFRYIQQACDAHLREHIEPALRRVLESYGQVVQIAFEGEAQNESILRVKYQSIVQPVPGDYFTPTVKLEIGVRGGPRPNAARILQPYTNLVDRNRIEVRNIVAIEPERTFWEKMLILHGYASYKQDGAARANDQNRLSRHYYDVAKIAQSEQGTSYLNLRDLGIEVRDHCDRTYRRATQPLDDFDFGRIKLIPEGDALKRLEADYADMQSMIFGEIPKFEVIMATVRDIETRCNADLTLPLAVIRPV